ncbi:uncharacterized protein [Rutidosis leptorrhynchoides]|uniref:uncharacterized protein n=1 Tax=Rutidosis leptorrhynchoides TaxID=125765 RepID=UPI003A9926DE
MEISRGRGKNKCYWKEEETELLIEVLQEMAADPSWKTITGFKSNYMFELHRRIVSRMPTFSKKVTPHIESKVKWLKTKFHIINYMVKQNGCRWNNAEDKIKCDRKWYKSYCLVHKEAKGMWDFRFPFFKQLETVYGNERSNGGVVQGNSAASRNLDVAIIERNDNAIHESEVEPNTESGSEYSSSESDDSLSDERENGVHPFSQATPIPIDNNGAIRIGIKPKTTPNAEDRSAKKQKTSPSSQDIAARLDEIKANFHTFVQGINANFAVLAKSMMQDNVNQKTESEKLKDVMDEIMKLNLSSDDLFKAAEIFAANKNKIDVFFSLPEQLRVSYVIRGFNASYSSIANAVTDDNIRQKLAMERLKDVIAEIMKFDLSSDEVFKAADMFAIERNRIDVFFCLPEDLRKSYVITLTARSSSN